MDITLRVADNFAPNPDELREKALAAEFKTETFNDGAEYTGISREGLPDLTSEISKVTGFPIKEVFSCYRINYAMELPHNHVHSDGICSNYAGILYLNPPDQCFGGTAFWKHKYCGWDSMLSDEELNESKICPSEFGKEMSEEWKKKEPWEMNGYVGMKFNRFITYPTKMFHSRYPHEAFGDRPENARLIWVVFYDSQGSD